MAQRDTGSMRLDDWHQSRTKEQIDHLFEVYATERQDDMNALVVAFAIATAGLTYVIAAVAYFAENCKDVDCAGVPEWIRFSAPAVTVVLGLASLSLMLLPQE